MPDINWIQNIIAAAIATSITWLFSKRKQKAETDDLRVDSVLKLVNVWRENCEHLMVKVEQLQLEYRELKIENAKLRMDISALKNRNNG